MSRREEQSMADADEDDPFDGDDPLLNMDFE